MPTFDTPQPITVSFELGVCDLRITASDRADTVVDILPTDPANELDVSAASQVRVDLTNGVLRISSPKARPLDYARHKMRSIDLVIELPSGSTVSGQMQMGDVRATGLLGPFDLKTSTGNVWLERTGPLTLRTMGKVTAQSVNGPAKIATGIGTVSLGDVTGAVVVKSTNGDITIEDAAGDVRVRAANGDVQVGRAGGGVDAKSSNGNVSLGKVVSGSVVLATGRGDLDVGIAEGTAAWLALDTGYGKVRNELDAAARPAESARTVEVRGRTGFGDITIHRA